MCSPAPTLCRPSRARRLSPQSSPARGYGDGGRDGGAIVTLDTNAGPGKGELGAAGALTKRGFIALFRGGEQRQQTYPRPTRARRVIPFMMARGELVVLSNECGSFGELATTRLDGTARSFKPEEASQGRLYIALLRSYRASSYPILPSSNRAARMRPGCCGQGRGRTSRPGPGPGPLAARLAASTRCCSNPAIHSCFAATPMSICLRAAGARRAHSGHLDPQVE